MITLTRYAQERRASDTTDPSLSSSSGFRTSDATSSDGHRADMSPILNVVPSGAQKRELPGRFFDVDPEDLYTLIGVC